MVATRTTNSKKPRLSLDRSIERMAASILGPSLTVPVADGQLALGTWQSVLLVELDGPRERTVRVTLFPT